MFRKSRLVCRGTSEVANEVGLYTLVTPCASLNVCTWSGFTDGSGDL